jgi:hypothetical protein
LQKGEAVELPVLIENLPQCALRVSIFNLLPYKPR